MQKICIVDWQMAGLSSPAADLSILLLTSTDKAFRAEHYDQLINLYYDELSAIIKRCGSDPLALFSRDNLNDQLRRFGKEGLIMSTFIVVMLGASESEMADLTEYSANNLESRVDEAPFFLSLTEQSRRKFVKQMSDIIADCIKYGWIDVASELKAAA